ARSAHKLIEIDLKHHFLNPGKTILDLGASPGGWTQVCLDRLRGRGRVIGVDLLDLDASVASRPHLDFVKGDLRHPDTLARLDALLRVSSAAGEEPERPPQVDVVLSDMLGNTSGNDVRDAQNSLELCELVVDLSQRYLTSEAEGTVVFKIFQSQDAAEWKKDRLEKLFKKISIFKPVSSRKESREVYYIC
ncbi:ribosomal RNA methyltransferase, partial [Cystobasidium minutum MCA 4210]|uniref:ribosomal RNA methyltransferase n=1 Tax=Cystobasidium minutum MCA 4210 TaxID=1397322 RepID=UPI0034CE6F8B